jgi:hypothetical protein
MMPEEFVQKAGALVASGRDRQALELTSKHLRELAPSMTSEQIVTVADFAHMAQMAVDLEEWDDANRREAEAEAPAARTF